VAHVIVAEIGVDMRQFPTSGHVVSWAGLCPGLNESAGKVLSRRLRKGAPWLKPVLVQAAWGANRKNDSYLQAQFLRLRARRGPKKAIVAVAASMLTAAYHILRDQLDYTELGSQYFLPRAGPSASPVRSASSVTKWTSTKPPNFMSMFLGRYETITLGAGRPRCANYGRSSGGARRFATRGIVPSRVLAAPRAALSRPCRSG
jgi:hypothetical protein